MLSMFASVCEMCATFSSLSTWSSRSTNRLAVSEMFCSAEASVRITGTSSPSDTVSSAASGEVGRELLQRLGAAASALRGPQPWAVEAHPFRIDTTDGIGRPTPEGAHRDGVDLVAVFMLGRHRIKGGESRVFEADGPSGQRFTLTEPWSLLLLDDARVIHETTPIQPLVGGELGWRDTLVLTYRSGGFQGD